MVKLYKCSKCGREVTDHIEDENGVYFCWNCGIDPDVDEVNIPEWIQFEASSIQKMNPKNSDVRYIIEIPKNLNYLIEELGEHIRRSKWKIQMKSQVR